MCRQLNVKDQLQNGKQHDQLLCPLYGSKCDKMLTGCAIENVLNQAVHML